MVRPYHQNFQIGDNVRITNKMNIFDKGYTERWTEEVFKISIIQLTIPVTYKITDNNGEVFKMSIIQLTIRVTYKITDYNGEETRSSFYEQELQKTKQDIFRIDKIIRQQGNTNLVKWLGY